MQHLAELEGPQEFEQNPHPRQRIHCCIAHEHVCGIRPSQSLRKYLVVVDEFQPLRVLRHGEAADPHGSLVIHVLEGGQEVDERAAPRMAGKMRRAARAAQIRVQIGQQVCVRDPACQPLRPNEQVDNEPCRRGVKVQHLPVARVRDPPLPVQVATRVQDAQLGDVGAASRLESAQVPHGHATILHHGKQISGVGSPSPCKTRRSTQEQL
mmetsp:Transcript_85407/g.261202  ORF Transcript_85407/g.261202 Transcript_85407/m.261202 type:complete len:210 (-) Transcript_85407:630-1259(-)